jgi:hypothetical protein
MDFSAWRGSTDVDFPGTGLRFDEACAIGVAASAGRRPGWVSIGIDLRFLINAPDPVNRPSKKAARDLCRPPLLGLSRSSQNSIAGQTMLHRA